MAAATLDPIDRAERGKAARAAAPRSSHAGWAPSADRRDPVAILEENAVTRVQELVPIRYGRMLASPFAFYRGGAAIMAADLAGTPDSGIRVQLCGDAHLSNFGVYTAPDRRLVFDLNDFDETHPGPWEWDVKRLVASLEIAGRSRSMRTKERRAIVLAAARAYRDAMRGFASAKNLAVWYARVDVEEFLAGLGGSAAKREVRSAQRAAAAARAKDSERALTQLTERVGDELRFRSAPPLLVRAADLESNGGGPGGITELLGALLKEYQTSLAPHVRQLVSTYRHVDAARKVVGVGSVGTRAWVVLLEGRDGGDPLVLQAKEAQASVLETHLGASAYENHGERVVQGQRFMQAASDVLLGWQRLTGFDGRERDFYIRQLWDGKGSADVDTMSADALRIYGELCGWTLARAHARSGDRVAIAAYLGGGDAFDRAIAGFAEAYADQNERDFRALEQDVADGRLEARFGL